MSTLDEQHEIQQDVTRGVGNRGWRFGSAAAWLVHRLARGTR